MKTALTLGALLLAFASARPLAVQQPPSRLAFELKDDIAAGKRADDASCAACRGKMARGTVNGGLTISIIEEHRGKQPPDLTGDQWEPGSGSGDTDAVIKRGLPPTTMAGSDAGIPDVEIRSIVNYRRTLPPK